MKTFIKIGCFIFFIVFSFTLSSQTIYKGFSVGMTEGEAKKEFRNSKDEYINIDLGNNFTYRIYKQNLTYHNGGLAAVMLVPKGSGWGIGYNNTRLYLDYTKDFFNEKGYKDFIVPEFWNAPINYFDSGDKWGLILENKEKDLIVQLYPQRYKGTQLLNVVLNIWNRKIWMELFEADTKRNEKIKEKSGF